MIESKERILAREIAGRVAAQGGRVYYVGGCVRDALRGEETKDIDIEVHGVTPEVLENILGEFGEVLTVGRSFGVFGLKGASLDIAMPRMEEATGRGHRDFRVFVDPSLPPEKAAKRRDFTVNAIMEDVLTHEIVDPYHGREDMEKKVLRHVSTDSFPEDPLRVLRGAQFSARFGYRVASETLSLFSEMDLSTLPKERVFGETEKALLKAKTPSVFFSVLRETNQLGDWFPECKSMIGVEQNPLHHAEGDVWNHTMLVLDETAALREKAVNPIGIMLAALVHDFGKITTTEFVNGEIHSYGHETAGLPLAEAFVKRLSGETALLRYILSMTELHMRPNIVAGANASVKSTNRLFDESVEPGDLILLSEADSKGSFGLKRDEYHTPFLTERLEVYREIMSRPFVTGKDLLENGIPSGKDFAEILAYAHKLRLAGIDYPCALKQTVSFAKKLRKENRGATGRS